MKQACNTTALSIAIGADHRGFDYKRILMQYTHIPGTMLTMRWHDVGAYDDERSDYPQFAQAAVELVVQGMAKYAVLLCGTGIGMAMAANRVPYIYAGVVWNEDIARRAREEDNVNILVIPVDYVTPAVMQTCVAAWLTPSFKGERYAERLQQIDE